MIKKYFFCIIILLFSIFANSQKYGQKAIDSLTIVLSKTTIDTARVNILNKIADNYRNQDPKLAIVYSKQGLQLSKKIKWNDGIAFSLRNIGQNHAIVGDLEKANKCFDLAFQYAESQLNKCLLYRAKGSINAAKANYSAAISYYYKALAIAEKIKIESEIGTIYYVLGNSYDNIKDSQKSIYFLTKSLEVFTKLNLKNLICSSLSSLADTYKADKNNALALRYNLKALKIAKKTNNIDAFTRINLSIAQVYMKEGNLEKGLEYNIIASKAAEKAKFYRYNITSKLNEAEIYIAQFIKDSTIVRKKYLLEKAEPLILYCIKNYKKANDKINLSTSYETLSYLYLLKKNYKKEATAIRQHAEIKDSIYSQKSKETIKNLEDQRTIDLKNKEILINKVILEKKENQKWFYISGIGFLCILGSLLFYQNQNRKKTNEKLQFLNNNLDQANKTKIKFLSILNHDLRSPVYNFIHFMQLLKESPELIDKKTKTEIETKTILSAENLLFSMEDLLLWSKGEMQNFEAKLKLVAINDMFDYTKKHFESEETVTIIFENFKNLSVTTDDDFLKTIIRNLTANAITAIARGCAPDNKKTSIVWKAYLENSCNYLSITDNGLGADLQQFKALYDENQVVGIKTGLGLHLIRDLAKAINCEISVQSKINHGTTFVLKFL